MPITGFRLHGAPELNRWLTTAIARIAPEERRRLRRAANLLRDEMRSRVRVRSGATKKAIKARSKTRRDLFGTANLQLVAMHAAFEIGPLGKVEGDDVFWARFLEYGVQPHALGKGSRIQSPHKARGGTFSQSGRQHPGHRALPFVIPSVEAKEDEVFRMLDVWPQVI